MNNSKYSIVCMKCGKNLRKDQIIKLNTPKTSGDLNDNSQISSRIPEIISVLCPYCRHSDMNFIPSDLIKIIQELVTKGYRVLKCKIVEINVDGCIDNKGIQIWFNIHDVPFDFEKSDKNNEFRFKRVHNFIGIISNLEPEENRNKYKNNSLSDTSERFNRILDSMYKWAHELPRII